MAFHKWGVSAVFLCGLFPDLRQNTFTLAKKAAPENFVDSFRRIWGKGIFKKKKGGRKGKKQIIKQRWRKPEKGRDIIFPDVEMRDLGKENYVFWLAMQQIWRLKITFLQSFLLVLDQFTLKMKMF